MSANSGWSPYPVGAVRDSEASDFAKAYDLYVKCRNIGADIRIDGGCAHVTCYYGQENTISEWLRGMKFVSYRIVSRGLFGVYGNKPGPLTAHWYEP